MSETLTLYNLTKKEVLHFVHLGGSTSREMAGGQDTSAVVTWYLIKNRGDIITFVSDYDDTDGLPMGITWDEVKDWPDRTDSVVDALIENEILQDYGRLYEDEDDPENIYIRDLRNCWDLRPRTKKQSRTDWERLEKMRDDEIDFSDIPELGADFFREATIVMPKEGESVAKQIMNLLQCDGKRKAA